MFAKSSLINIASLGILLLFFCFLQQPVTQAASITAQDWLKVGSEQTQREDYQQALLSFDRALALDSNLAAAYSDRCLARIHLNDYQKAKQDCSKALKIQPANELAYLHRGLAAYRLGDYTNAIADYNSALQLQPNNVPAYYNRGLAYAAKGNYREAIANYESALKRLSRHDNSQLSTVYSDRGLAYFSLGNLEKARADYDKAIALDRHNSLAYYNRAVVCQRWRREREAIADFTLSLQSDPDRAEAYINRGLLRHQLGYHQSALDDLHRGAECLCQQGQMIAYQRILGLIAKIRRNFANFESIIA